MNQKINPILGESDQNCNTFQGVKLKISKSRGGGGQNLVLEFVWEPFLFS